MYLVSGWLIIGAAAICCSVSSCRRHALGLRAPLRYALAATLASVSAIALDGGPFTADQSRQGRALYAAHCAQCHGAQLQGAGEAPALSGATFIAALGSRSSDELYNLVKASMPYGNGNSLDADTYRRIVSFVLAANGAKPGATLALGAAVNTIDPNFKMPKYLKGTLDFSASS